MTSGNRLSECWLNCPCLPYIHGAVKHIALAYPSDVAYHIINIETAAAFNLFKPSSIWSDIKRFTEATFSWATATVINLGISQFRHVGSRQSMFCPWRSKRDVTIAYSHAMSYFRSWQKAFSWLKFGNIIKTQTTIPTMPRNSRNASIVVSAAYSAIFESTNGPKKEFEAKAQ